MFCLLRGVCWWIWWCVGECFMVEFDLILWVCCFFWIVTICSGGFLLLWVMIFGRLCVFVFSIVRVMRVLVWSWCMRL